MFNTSLSQAVLAGRSVARIVPVDTQFIRLEQELASTRANLARVVAANNKLLGENAALRAELEAQPQLSLRQISNVVASFYGVTYFDIIGDRRTVKTIKPRHVVFYLARHLTPLSFTQIGRLIGNRDHSTVVHAYQKIEEQRKTDPGLQQELADLVCALDVKPVVIGES